MPDEVGALAKAAAPSSPCCPSGQGVGKLLPRFEEEETLQLEAGSFDIEMVSTAMVCT
jgi:hypothetical protein